MKHLQKKNRFFDNNVQKMVFIFEGSILQIVYTLFHIVYKLIFFMQIVYNVKRRY